MEALDAQKVAEMLAAIKSTSGDYTSLSAIVAIIVAFLAFLFRMVVVLDNKLNSIVDRNNQTIKEMAAVIDRASERNVAALEKIADRQAGAIEGLSREIGSLRTDIVKHDAVLTQSLAGRRIGEVK